MGGENRSEGKRCHESESDVGYFNEDTYGYDDVKQEIILQLIEGPMS